MAKTVKINGITYENVPKVEIPLAADPDTKAVFVDTSDATAVAASIKDGETAYVDGEKVEGSMPVNTAVSGKITTKDGTVAVPQGYHPNGGSVSIDSSAVANLIPANVRKGVSVLGVTGSMDSTEGMKGQTKTVTPTKSVQTVTPDDGYNCLNSVTVNAIPTEYITTTDANATAADIKNGKSAYVNGKKVVGTHTDPVITQANGVLSIS